MKKPDCFIYGNGFTIRLRNRRIVSKRQKDGWLITLIRIWPKGEKLRKRDFDRVIDARFGQKITVKRLLVSEEAYRSMAEGFLVFNGQIKVDKNTEP